MLRTALIIPKDLPELVRIVLKDVMLRLGQHVPVTVSPPFHPDGVWFVDLVWHGDVRDNKLVVMYSPKWGWGLSLNNNEFGNAPDERPSFDTVVSRAVELLTQT